MPRHWPAHSATGNSRRSTRRVNPPEPSRTGQSPGTAHRRGVTSADFEYDTKRRSAERPRAHETRRSPRYRRVGCARRGYERPCARATAAGRGRCAARENAGRSSRHARAARHPRAPTRAKRRRVGAESCELRRGDRESVPEPARSADPAATARSVTTAAPWWNARRPEIVEEFEREVVGRVPAAVPSVGWSVVETREWLAGGRPRDR